MTQLERHPAYQKVVGLFASQGMHGRQPINLSVNISLSPPPPTLLQTVNDQILRGGLKKKIEKRAKYKKLHILIIIYSQNTNLQATSYLKFLLCVSTYENTFIVSFLMDN